MTEVNSSNDPLSFFDDDKFSSIDFIDSLINQSNNNKSLNLDENSQISTLSKTFNQMIYNLTLHNQSLSKNLNDEMNNLKKVTAILGEENDNKRSTSIINNDFLDNFNDEDEEEDETKVTRLQYYVESLLNITNPMTESCEKIIDKYKTFENTEDQIPIITLIKLKKIQTKLFQIQQLFETSKFIATISNKDEKSNETVPEDTTNNELIITPKSFQESLNILDEILEEQLSVNLSIMKSTTSTKSQSSITASNKDILGKIKSLIELQEIFDGLNYYNDYYLKFVTKIQKAKDDFLKAEESLKDFSITKQNNTSNDAIIPVPKVEAKTNEKLTVEKVEETVASGFGGFMNFFGKNV